MAEQDTNKIEKEFRKEFAEMMRKYGCEMTIATSTRGYDMSVDGVEFEFDGIYKDGEVIRDYFTVNVGTWFNKDSA